MRPFSRSLSNAILLLLAGSILYVLGTKKYKDIGVGEISYLRIPMFEIAPTSTSIAIKVETVTSTVHQVSVVTVTSEPISTGFAPLDKQQNEKLHELKHKISTQLLTTYNESDTTNNYYGAISQALNQELANQDVSSSFPGITNDILRHQVISELLKDSIGNTDPKEGLHTKDRQSYYKHILKDIIVKNKPFSFKLSKSEQGQPLHGKPYRFTDDPRFTRSFLETGRVVLPDETFEDLQFHHRNIVKQLKHTSLPPKKFYHGDGIVILTSQDFLPGALVTIGQLRETGSLLPIEVILDYEKDYDYEMCEVMLPKLNARCLIVERELGPELMKSLGLKKFLLKVVGVLVSRFDNIILLDADNIPIKNVDKLLESDAYRDTKFLLWPDMWHRGTSPMFYDLIDREIGEVVHREGLKNNEDWDVYLKQDKHNGVAFNDLEGTFPGRLVETGQMIFSMVEHFRAFVLALYYNVYGDSHYYYLLFQGSFGEGDRETFLPALEVMNEPYYLSTYNVWLTGFIDSNNMARETTIIQYDIDQTYHFEREWRSWLKKKKLDTRLTLNQENEYTRSLVQEFTKDEKLEIPDIMFLHMHRPKVNPIINADPKHPENWQAFDKHKRNLEVAAKLPEFKGRDWELKVQSISKWVACEFLTDSYWKNSRIAKNEVCQKVGDFVTFLRKTSRNQNDEILTVLPTIGAGEGTF